MARPLMALAVAGILAACTVAPNEPVVDDSKTPSSTFYQTSTTATCPAVQARSVLVDPSHDGGTWWFPQYHPQPSGYNPDSTHQGWALAKYLRGRGYTVRELGRNATMSQDSMLTYAVIIRAGYSQANSGYAPADLSAYAAFLACPRTLLLLGEYLRDGNRDPLADALGIRLGGIVTGTITDFTPHAITASVTSVPYIAGSFLSDDSDSAVQVLGRLPTGERVMGVRPIGTAKVFFIGDINGIELVPQPFVNNLVAWGFPF